MSEHDAKPAKQSAEPLFPNFDELRRKEPPEARLGKFPDSIGVGDHIVGSKTDFNLVHPRLTTQYASAATAELRVRPVAAEVSRSAPDELREQLGATRRIAAFSTEQARVDVRAGVPITMRFSPVLRGKHEADVDVVLQWDDGVRDHRTVRVHGTARKLEDAPLETPLVAERAQYREPRTLPPADLRGVNDTGLAAAFERAKIEAGALARQQQLGVLEVERAVADYHPKPDERDVLEWLVEVAVSFGVAGVAGMAARMVASKLGPKLAALITKSGEATEAAEKYAEVAIADTVKDTLKNAARKPTVKAILHREEPGKEPDKAEFFQRQDKALAELDHENRLTVLHQYGELQHLLLHDPARATATMEAIGEGYSATREEALRQQAHATGTQWVSLIARTANKSSTATVEGQSVQTTNLSKASGATQGVLRIRVIDGRVRSASIDGVPGSVARDLLTTNLRLTPIPLVILQGDSTVITRDEAGRVRLTHYSRDLETEHHAHAQRLVDRVTSMTLAQWGVESIVADKTRVDP